MRWSMTMRGLHLSSIENFDRQTYPTDVTPMAAHLKEKKEALGEIYYDDLPLWGSLGKHDKEGKDDPSEYAYDEETADDQEETGWKYIHGDAFRYPKHKSLFAAALGSGTQLFILAIFIFILALIGVFYPYNREALFTVLVVIYALTSGIAGYTGVSFYYLFEGTNWHHDRAMRGPGLYLVVENPTIGL
ncbi:hypothetical protein LguiA_005491 [Lonicera macranthoides]